MKAEAVFFSLNPLTSDLVARCRNRLEIAKNVDVATKTDVIQRRLMLIDLVSRRPSGVSATDEEKAHASKKLDEIFDYLRSRKWPILIQVDSGNGFHLLYPVDLPAEDGGLVSRCLKALSAKFSDDSVEVDTSVHDAVHLCKVPGTVARKGDDTEARPHRKSELLKSPKTLKVVPHALIEELARECEIGTICHADPLISNEIVRRARHYVDRMPEAVSGQLGHSALFAVACRLIIDFDLSQEAAFPILQEYNTRCKPPWPEAELKRKIQEAEKESGERGRLVITTTRNQSTPPNHQPAAGQKNFHVAVPDFTLFDKGMILRTIEDYETVGRFEPIFWCEVWRHQRSDALVPDVLLRQCRWGANAPRNWRRDLKGRLGNGYVHLESQFPNFRCQPNCPLYLTGIRHQHYHAPSTTLNGLLECFVAKRFKTDHRKYDLFGQQFAKLRREYTRLGKLYLVYWPLLLFANSRRIKMTTRRQLLLLAITRELTHDSDSRRTDKASVIENARVAVGRNQHSVTCPLLDHQRRYVVFGGNGKGIFKGKGYQLLSSGWLPRAGYTNQRMKGCLWARVGEFLDDLAILENDFQLTVVGRHSAEKRWLDLNDLRARLRSKGGQIFLQRCAIRVFAPEDYLILWRSGFARRLSFDWIPTTADDLFDDHIENPRNRIRNGAQLREFLQTHKMTQQELANRMGASRERVNRHATGKSKSAQFFADLDRIVDQIGGIVQEFQSSM